MIYLKGELLCLRSKVNKVLRHYLIKMDVTKRVAMRPRQAKTTAAIGSGSPQRTYWTGIGSQPGAGERHT